MKLTAILLLGLSLHLSARTHSQTVTYSIANVDIRSVFKQVEKQTGFTIFYNKELLKGTPKISVNAVNTPLEDFMRTVLKNLKLEFSIENKTIVIMKGKTITEDLTPRLVSPFDEAPPIKITGSIVDAKNQPLVGTTIRVKGKNISTISDEKGHFEIHAESGNTGALKPFTLIFTHVGFLPQEISVSNDNFLTIILQANDSALNEVVVTGFGSKTETRKLSYSIQEVKGADLARAGSTNIINSLQGKVSGVVINQGTGGPASSSRIRIRGNTSINDKGNSMPLFVVDGVLIQPDVSGVRNAYGETRDFGNQLKNLNPDDYESVTVLKGSAASALYGSQAQNGVILITTKKGRARKGLGVTVNHQTMWESVYKLPAFQNEYGGGLNQFFTGKDAEGHDMIGTTYGESAYSFGPKFDGHTIRDANGLLVPWQPNNLRDLFGTGNSSVTNVSVEGGNERTTVRLSLTSTSSSSIQPNNGFNRYNFALRATQKIGSFIMLDASINYSNSVTKNPILQASNSNPLFAFSYARSRNTPIKYILDNYIDTVNGGRQMLDGINPYLDDDMTYKLWDNYQVNYRHQENNLLSNIDLTATITPWLSLLVRGNMYNTLVENENKTRGDGPRFASTGRFGSYEIAHSSITKLRVQSLLTANKQLSQDLNFSASIGGETQRDIGGYSSDVSTVGGFRIPEIYSIANSKLPPTTSTADIAAKTRLDAVYAYGDITYKDMITFNVSARNDWNSTLTYPDGHGTYSYFYPSAGVSWVFSELLAKNSSFNFLSLGKLRASLGYTGSGTSAYTTSSGNYALLGNFVDYDGTIRPRYGLASPDLENKNLKPERTREYEFGADLRFFNNRLRLDVAAYKKNTTNQIIFLSAPLQSGIATRLINAGDVQNTGVEIYLSGTPIQKQDFSWTTSFNYSRNRNKIISLYPGVTRKILDYGEDIQSVALVGGDFGTIVTNYAFTKDEKTGKNLLKSDGTFYRSSDYGTGEKVLGTMLEKFLLSNINELYYKNFSLFTQVDAKIGGLISSATHAYGSQYGAFKSTLFGRDKEHGGISYTDDLGRTLNDGILPDGVFAPGTALNGTDVSGMTYEEAYGKGLAKPIPASTYYNNLTSWGTGIREYSVFENSWVAVREISIGYSLPSKITSKLHFNSLRLSLIGRNLVYLYTTSKDDINPENLGSSRSGAFAEYGGLPYVRSYGFSIRGGF